MTGQEQEMDVQETSSGGPERPVTGDPGVDRITADLEEALRDGQQDPTGALTEAHRRLQARLSDPGPTPPTSG